MPEPFKNIYNKTFIQQLASTIFELDSSFLQKDFTKHILKQLDTLELKQRMRLISWAINEYWDKDYIYKIEILKMVKQQLPENKNSGLALMIFPDFIQQFGLNHFEESLKALAYFTINSSSEFAIREFIILDEEKTMKQMLLWAKDDNEHIRRLSSEGCRPRLPWAIALNNFKMNPSKVFEVLELLKHDKSLYVRKSVANNLNDISKDHPDMVIEFIKNNIHINKELNWILKHGARSLLRSSNKETLHLFGYQNSTIEIKNLKFQNSIKLGENLSFSFELFSSKNLGQIRIEYAIDLLRKNGQYNSKVFHLFTGKIDEKTKYVKGKHSFKKVTTRNYYVGKHTIYIIINGIKLAQFDLQLMA